MKPSGIGDVLVPKLTGLISQASSDEFLTDTLVGLIESFFSSAGAGLGLAIGILAAAWAGLQRVRRRVHPGHEPGVPRSKDATLVRLKARSSSR